MLKAFTRATALLAVTLVAWGAGQSQPVKTSFDSAAKVFRLDGGGTSYVFGVNPQGELQQLYWGGRLGAARPGARLRPRPRQTSHLPPHPTQAPQTSFFAFSSRWRRHRGRANCSSPRCIPLAGSGQRQAARSRQLQLACCRSPLCCQWRRRWRRRPPLPSRPGCRVAPRRRWPPWTGASGTPSPRTARTEEQCTFTWGRGRGGRGHSRRRLDAFPLHVWGSCTERAVGGGLR